MSNKSILLLLFSVVMLFGCNTEQKKTSTEDNEQKEVRLISPDFNADSAFAYTKAQVDFGPRIPSTPAHAKCADYLQQKLKSFGAEVFIQQAPVKTYDGKTHQLKNIIAAFSPEKKQRILITAHWDARPFSDMDNDEANKDKSFDAANDGASGVAVILEMARQIQLKEPSVGIDFILWDIEDYGSSNDDTKHHTTWCLGSQYWAKNPTFKEFKPLYAINLDMVGGSNATFAMDEISRQYAPEIVQKVWDIADELGYSNYFVNKNSPNLIDDHYWINQTGIKCIDIIDFSETGDFYKNWHTQFDNLNNIDRNTLKAVGQVVLETIYREKPAA